MFASLKRSLFDDVSLRLILVERMCVLLGSQLQDGLVQLRRLSGAAMSCPDCHRGLCSCTRPEQW